VIGWKKMMVRVCWVLLEHLGFAAVSGGSKGVCWVVSMLGYLGRVDF